MQNEANYEYQTLIRRFIDIVRTTEPTSVRATISSPSFSGSDAKQEWTARKLPPKSERQSALSLLPDLKVALGEKRVYGFKLCEDITFVPQRNNRPAEFRVMLSQRLLKDREAQSEVVETIRNTTPKMSDVSHYTITYG